MLRLIQIGNALPVSYPVDPTATFQPGQVAQLKVMGNEIVCGVSDGTAPFGVIDDINTNAFTKSVVDEVVDIPAVGVADAYGNYYSATPVMQLLDNASIVRSSFTTDTENISLHDINGAVTAEAGTLLNKDLDGDGIPDTIRIVVSYSYRIANIPGDNTTAGSGRMTVWVHRGIYETDQFDTSQRYALNAVLFVSALGQLTTRQPTPTHPGVAMVTGPPTALNETLEFIWL